MGEPTRGTQGGRLARRRLDVKQAAETLGTTVDAVRKRIRRGTLEAERVDGKVYIWLDVEQDAVRTGAVDAVLEAKDETIAELREQLDFLRRELEVRTEELRRKDSIIVALTSRVPELRLPAGAQETPENIAEQPGEREGTRPDAEGALEPTLRSGRRGLLGRVLSRIPQLR